MQTMEQLIQAKLASKVSASVQRKIAELKAGLPGIYEQYGPIIDKASKKHKINPDLIALMILKESGGNRYAVSKNKKGEVMARGLMQLMPAVISDYGVKDPFDIEQNIMAGTALIDKRIERRGGNLMLALSDYNQGATNTYRVSKGTRDMPTETDDYIQSIMGAFSGEPRIDLLKKDESSEGGEPFKRITPQSPEDEDLYPPMDKRTAEEIHNPPPNPNTRKSNSMIQGSKAHTFNPEDIEWLKKSAGEL